MKTRFNPLSSLVRWAVACATLGLLSACGGGGSDGDDAQRQYPAAAPAALSGPVAGHVDRLQEVRARLGLAPLSWDGRLAQAAQSHADYLTRHSAVGHAEDPALAGFTGAGYWERANRAGYARAMGETIIHGNATTYEEGRSYLDALLYSPGHRAYLLASDLDEFGVGGIPLTTVLGRSGNHLRRVAVTFPFDGQENVYTSVILSLSGSLAGRVVVSSFQLRDRATGADVAVQPWPNEGTGAVLFKPEQQLAFGTWYDATVTGTVDGVTVQKTVAFKTN
jgi:hypothetical protein